jgi:hypothetical protein
MQQGEPTKVSKYYDEAITLDYFNYVIELVKLGYVSLFLYSSSFPSPCP